MRYRQQRFAWSILWAIPCLLLIALSVRSYYVCDYVFRRGKPIVVTAASNPTVVKTTVASNAGMAHVIDTLVPAGPPSHGWKYGSRDAADSHTILQWMMGPNAGGGTTHSIWFMAFVCAVISALSWLPWRFSLRTLLIAMTLVAVGLGIVVTLR